MKAVQEEESKFFKERRTEECEDIGKGKLSRGGSVNTYKKLKNEQLGGYSEI